MIPVRVRLPELYCPFCAHQLVNMIFVLIATDELLCVHCARDREPAEVRAVTPDGGAFLPGAELLDPADAVTLLIRRAPGTCLEPDDEAGRCIRCRRPIDGPAWRYAPLGWQLCGVCARVEPTTP